MNLSKTLFAALLATLILAVGAARADETYSPGVNSAYTYLTGVPITGSYVQQGTIQILKGRRNRVLEVDLQITDTQAVAAALATYVAVNGVQISPGVSNIPVMTDCDPAFTNCTMTSNFWADLDQLETDYPGMFKNQPLVLSLFVIDGGGVTTGTLTARARMLKK